MPAIASGEWRDRRRLAIVAPADQAIFASIISYLITRRVTSRISVSPLRIRTGDLALPSDWLAVYNPAPPAQQPLLVLYLPEVGRWLAMSIAHRSTAGVNRNRHAAPFKAVFISTISLFGGFADTRQLHQCAKLFALNRIRNRCADMPEIASASQGPTPFVLPAL